MQKNKPQPPVYEGAPAGFSISNAEVARHAVAQKNVTVANTVAQEVVLNAISGTIIVTALTATLLLRFNVTTGDTAVSSTTFDEVIPAGTQKKYVLDATVNVLSLIAVGAAANVFIVEN